TRARFGVEAFAKLGVRGKGRRKDLDGHDSIETRVAGLVDLAHPARAEERRDLIHAEAATDERRPALVCKGPSGGFEGRCVDEGRFAIRGQGRLPPPVPPPVPPPTRGAIP